MKKIGTFVLDTLQIFFPWDDDFYTDLKDKGFGRSGFETQNLPECTNQVLTLSPVQFSNIYEIVPLGNLNPPDHTLPTEHMYFYLGESPPVSPVNIVAPGDLYLLQIQSTEYLDEGRADYGLTLALCRDIRIYFLHIQSLEQEFKSLITDTSCREASSSSDHGDGGGNYRYCSTSLNKKIDAGTLIGKVGGSQNHAFDFGAYDYRVRHEFMNPARYTSKSPNVICPLELYDDETKIKLFGEVRRNIEPRCGKSWQDVKGALQGNWFFGDVTAESPSDWQKHLAFVQYNFDPTQSAISVGGVFMQAGYWTFTPQHSGLVNLAFNEVKADGNVYCYSGGAENGQGGPIPGRILVQLVSERELKIELQGGGCSGNAVFRNPVIYFR